MDFSDLYFNTLQDISSYQRCQDAPRISISAKAYISMNRAFRKKAGGQREFRSQSSPDGRYLVFAPMGSPDIHFSAKGGRAIHLKLAKCLKEKGISLPAAYTMVWCQERQAWIGCCEELPQPPSFLGFQKRKREDRRKGGRTKRKQRNLSPREQRLIDGFIENIFQAQHIWRHDEDLYQCAWEAFLGAYRDDPGSFSFSNSQGWELAYFSICDALAEARRLNNFCRYCKTSLDQPVSSDISVPRIQLLQSPHGDFQNGVCFHDYLHHMEKDLCRTAYHLIYGYSKAEIQAHYGWDCNYTDQVFHGLITEIRGYIAI